MATAATRGDCQGKRRAGIEVDTNMLMYIYNLWINMHALIFVHIQYVDIYSLFLLAVLHNYHRFINVSIIIF